MEIYNSQIPMTTKEKIRYFWDYYKWWLIGGAAALIMALSTAVNLASIVEADMKIIVGTKQMLIDAQTEALESDLEAMIYDYNNDGKVKVDVINIVLAPSQITMGQTGISKNEDYIDPELQMAMEAKLYAELTLGDAVIFLFTEEIFNYTGLAGMNIDMEALYGEQYPNAKGELLPAADLALYQAREKTVEGLPEGLFLCMRDLD